MAYSTFWGVLLIACAGLSLAGGLYATKGIHKAAINKILMIICAALLVWSLGLAINVAAANAEIGMIGYFIAPIGWGPMSGLLLHFTLLFTGKEKLLKKWWIYPLLYFPGLMMIYQFTILQSIGHNTDGLIHTMHGWVPVLNYDIWDYLFYAYYIGFTVINLMVLLITGKTSKDKSQKDQAMLLAICYIISYTLGTLSDTVSGLLDISLPRHATVYALIPLGAIAYIVKRYGSMSTETVKKKEFFNIDAVYSYVYQIMGFAFVIGSIVNIVLQKIIYKEVVISNISEFSVLLIAIALFILMVNKFKIEGSLKEMLIAMAYSFSIPYITLRFVPYGSITIWAFIFLMIIISLIYSRQILLITIAASAFMTQLLVWAISPEVLVEVNSADYILRLVLIGISLLFSIYVNSVYVTKLNENLSYDKKQAILSEISQDFISAADWNKDEILHNFLGKCGKSIGSERSYIILFNRDKVEFEYFCEWLEEGAQTQWKDFESISLDVRHRLLKQFDLQRILKLSDVNVLPPFARQYKQALIEQNIRGMVNLSIREKGETIGIIGFNSSRPLNEWNIDSTGFLEIVANLVSDMLQKIKAENRNELLAYYDQLTQLPNRILFKDCLEQVIKQAKETEKMIGVVFMDIDSFKMINDTLGHDLGDNILFEVAKVLSRSIGNNGTVARFGGDEFIIILNQLSNAKDVARIMADLMHAVNEPLDLHGQEFFVTISAGIALYPRDGEDSDTLIKNADTAMYRAKEMGKNRYLMCSQEMKDEELERLELTNKLYRALEREQFTVYYQPQINIETKKIVGLEALLRWSLPGKGMVSPDTFIPIAEQTRLINPIGEWVLETACRQNKLWQEKGHEEMRIAVNISIYQLISPGFIQQVEGILRKTGLSAEYLELEITESAASYNIDIIVNILKNLKALGIKISIDDFGTEYSSLSRLKMLPIDRIKIDMQFIQGIEGDEKDQAIAKVIINLAKSMNLKVVAEGVETNTQLNFLSQRMCDEVQGFYYYEPMPAEEIEKIL